MNYLQLLLLIEQNKEKHLASDSRSIITDKHRYIKEVSSGSWYEDKEPGMPERRHGRGGEYYVWLRDSPQ